MRASLRSSTRADDAAFELDRSRSYGDPRAQNLIVHGDNRGALRWLVPKFHGAFRCAYLDPPFNTGRTFAQYSDALDPRIWVEEIEARLELCAPLLADDGAIVVEIDDTELGALIGAMDRVFGRTNRVSIITLTRSAPTGHKAQNRGPVNVTDFLLLYAKDKSKWAPTPVVCKRRGFDRAYNLFIPNRDESPEAWRYVPLSQAVAESLGFANRRAAVNALGTIAFSAELERFAIARAIQVARYAQPRYEAVSHAARALIDRSRAEKKNTFCLKRPGHKDMILVGGNRVLFLDDKVRDIGGERTLVEPLTNVWADIPFQGIAREGGVVFVRNKKPERLIERILQMCTRPGDWVLDPYLGSGTTAAVAQKMNRRWVGIEQGDHLNTLALPRMRRVVGGEDPTGISKDYGWAGGGGFLVYA